MVATASLTVLLPPVRTRLLAAATVARALGLSVPSPGVSITVRAVTLAPGVRGDVYQPPGRHQAIVLVYGGTPLGLRDPRVIRLARALALAGRTVYVPELEIRHRLLDPVDVQRIVDAVTALPRQPGVRGRVGLFGFSVGGSYALVAAADPTIARKIAFVATFGAFYDATDVISGITTNATLVNGRIVPWHPDPRAAGALAGFLEEFVPPGQQPALRAALAGGPVADLPPAARSVYAVLTNRNPRRVAELVARLPPALRTLLAELSPRQHITGVHAPAAIMQSTDDPAVPPGQARQLAAALHAPRYEVHAFNHVTARSFWAALPDLWTVVRFASWVFSRQ